MKAELHTFIHVFHVNGQEYRLLRKEFNCPDEYASYKANSNRESYREWLTGLRNLKFHQLHKTKTITVTTYAKWRGRMDIGIAYNVYLAKRWDGRYTIHGLVRIPNRQYSDDRRYVGTLANCLQYIIDTFDEHSIIGINDEVYDMSTTSITTIMLKYS